MDVAQPKKQCVFLHGAEDSEARGCTLQEGPITLDTYSDLQQAMCPPFRGAFWVAQVSHLYHMNIYDFYTSSN